MLTQPVTQPVQIQDFKVLSEVDLVLEIARQNGWKDCHIFGYGDMITQPQESMGWKLIPVDIYEYSIPAEGVDRIVQVVHAGVRIQGVIIADDLQNPNPPPAPAKPAISLPSAGAIIASIGKALRRLAAIAGAVLLGLTMIAVVGVILLGLAAWARAALHGLTMTTGLLILAPVLILCAAMNNGSERKFDPKLIILVDDGNGGTTWVSVLTWFD